MFVKVVETIGETIAKAPFLRLDSASRARLACEIEANLRKALGGQQLYVPTVNRETERNTKIRAARSTGATIVELMRDYNLSRRQVWRILRETN